MTDFVRMLVVPILALVAIAAPAVGAEAPDVAAAPAKRALGPLQALRIEPSGQAETPLLIRGSDARQQLFVTGVYSDAQLRDLTHNVEYKVVPAGILEVDAMGLVVPLKDGEAIVHASSSGQQAQRKVRVTGVANQIPVNFKNQIVPIFTKLGCNSGGCHGKASGQNGFKLSLLGFYPEDDYEFLVKEARGRRLSPTHPAASLLLTKAVGRSPHGGGKRMDVGSYEYRMIRRWIVQGAPYGDVADPVVAGIQCLPEGRVMERGADQQITVVATYTDGTTEDVTRMALYEPNDTEMAEVTASGIVKTLDLSGEVAVMARYQGQVSTFRATIPLGADTQGLPKPANFVDEAVFAKLRLLGIPASSICTDETFLRRVYVDVAGTTPTQEEVSAFLADKDPHKRNKLIDRLLDTTAYADHFANKWNMVLRNKKRQANELEGTYAFYQWIWASLYDNKPYDQFVREIITASGQSRHNPAVVWYREVDQLNEQVEDTAQLFLGLRIQCARCHHHPFEKWSQDDYYGMQAFFSRIGKKNAVGLATNNREKRIFHNEGKASARNPKSGKNLSPTGLGVEAFDIPADQDPRTFLADWMAKPENPFFAPALVNRYWKHFFSRGIVEPEDDMRETNPPTNPELLNGLAKHFVDSGFDLKGLVRVICHSKT
ncbi:MAG: DUF1549 domain-containing protein, partial [Planctomycetaceae bacterium]